MSTLIYHRDPQCRWVVAQNETVVAGTEIATGVRRQHAALSGTVTTITNQRLEISVSNDAIKPTWAPLGSPARHHEILQRIEMAGITGLGGGGFPTHLKLVDALRKSVSKLVINAVECEPGISCDAALVQQSPAEIIRGIEVLAGLLGAEVHVALSNATHALDVPTTWQRHDLGEPKTPLGAERFLCRALFDKQLGSDFAPGERPTDKGFVVVNIGTAHAIARAMDGWPLTERMVTVNGTNRWLPIGTPLHTLVDDAQCLVGGVLSGERQTTQSGLTKTTNAVHTDHQHVATPCIRCSACDEVCPENLSVAEIVNGPQESSPMYTQTMQRLKADRCIECGLCTPVCPSNIDVLDLTRQARRRLTATTVAQREAQLARTRYEAHNARVEHRLATKRDRRAKRLEQIKRA